MATKEAHWANGSACRAKNKQTKKKALLTKPWLKILGEKMEENTYPTLRDNERTLSNESHFPPW